MINYEEKYKNEAIKLRKQVIAQTPEEDDLKLIAKFRDEIQTGDAEVEPISLEKARKLVNDARGIRD